MNLPPSDEVRAHVEAQAATSRRAAREATRLAVAAADDEVVDLLTRYRTASVELVLHDGRAVEVAGSNCTTHGVHIVLIVGNRSQEWDPETRDVR